MCSTCGCGMPDEPELTEKTEDSVCEKCGQDPCECPPEKETSSEEPTEESEDVEDEDFGEDLEFDEDDFDDDDESLM